MPFVSDCSDILNLLCFCNGASWAGEEVVRKDGGHGKGWRPGQGWKSWEGVEVMGRDREHGKGLMSREGIDIMGSD